MERACDGVDALAMAKAGRYAVVVLDVNLPRLGGLEVLKAVRRTKPYLPIVVVSEFVGPAAEAECINLGADDFISKSFHEKTFQARVVRAHPYLVGEVVGNLVDNAVKYTDGGSVSVAVESAGRYARLIVSDTGRGIPRAEQKSVFRRFYRASNAGDRVGSGLGLATVREIVESRYGGKVSLSSTPGRGSTFTVTFPRSL